MASQHPFSKSMSSLMTVSSTRTSAFSYLTTTTSSGSTIPGPGALSGKAILALGKITLRSAEYFIIRRRLRVISSNFPHTNGADIKDIEQIYDDALELSRFGLYPDTIRKRIIILLLGQIGSRQSRHLVKSLVRWPFIEIQIFISELTSLLDPFRLSSLAKSSPDPEVLAYEQSLANWESHSLAPFIDFLRQLAQSSDTASNAVLEGGAMDFLLHLYVSNFRDPLAESDRGGFDRKSTLHAACNSLLAVVSDAKKGIEIVYRHPFHILWSTRPQLPFTSLILNRAEQRVEVWSSMTTDVIFWRIHSIFDMMLDWTRQFDDHFLLDIAIDLLELSGSDSMAFEISIRALRSLHRLISRGNVPAQRAIIQYLALSTEGHFIEIMQRIVNHLEQLITPDTPEAKIFFLRWDDEEFKENAVLHFIHCFLNIAKVDDRFLNVMVSANILGLLRPFLQMENIPEIAHHTGDLLTVYAQPELDFVARIQEHGLDSLLPPLPEESKYSEVYRRSVLCRAYNVFLHRGDHHDFPEFWHTRWDDLPSGVEGSDYASFWIS